MPRWNARSSLAPLGRAAAAAAFLAVLCLGAVRLAAAGPATAVIEKLNAEFIKVMQNGPALGYEGRYRELAPVLTDSFDFAVMARVAAGRHWAEMTEAQQAKLVDSFQRYSLAIYAARFKDYSGEKFEILGEEAKQKGAVLVQNQIVKSDGEPIRIDYLLRPEDGQLRIIDVFLKSSVSEMAVRRAEFSEVLGSGGVDALVATLEQRIADIESGKILE
jgi:phospholipid transport system substrate-binding protein